MGRLGAFRLKKISRITKNTTVDGWHRMMDGNTGTNPSQEESRYEAEDYAMPGLGYNETEPLCHCNKCEKKRQIFNKLTEKKHEWRM